MIAELRLALALIAGTLSACVIDTVPMPEGTGGTGDIAADNGAGGAGGSMGGGYGDGGIDAGAEDDRGEGGALGDPEAPPTGEAGLRIDGSRIYWSDLTPFVFLAGVEGAMPGPGTVIIIPPQGSSQTQVTSAANGSFTAVVDAAIFDTLDVSFLVGETVVDEALLYLAPGSVEAYAANDDLDGELDPDAAAIGLVGVVRNNDVTITVYGSPGAVPPGIAVVVSNRDKGIATRAFAGADGTFEAILEAETGDELLIFAAEPASSNGGGATISLVAP